MSTVLPLISLILQSGDGSLVDAVDCSNSDGNILIERNSITLSDTALAFRLTLVGADQRDIDSSVDSLWAKIRQAENASGTLGHGTRVVAALRIGDPSDYRYLDITGGTIVIPPATLDIGHLSGTPGPMLEGVAVTLFRLPALRAEPIYDTVTATKTNGASTSTLFRDAVPGSLPALLRVELTDVSTGSVVINRVRLGVYSDRDAFAASAFPGIIDATNRSPGTESGGGQANTIGGKYSRVAVTNAWQAAADLSISVRGYYALWARVRDAATATAGIVSITGAVASYASGSLPAGGYTLMVVAVDGSGTPKVLAISQKVPAFLHSEGTISGRSILLTWTAVTGAIDYRVYWRRDFNAWLYLAIGGAGTSYTLSTESGATTADPPTAVNATLTSALARVSTRLPSGAVVRDYPEYSFQLSNSKWEALPLMADTVPPIGRGESVLGEGSLGTVQFKSGGSNTQNVDSDGGWLMPQGEGRFVTASYRTMDLATKRTWVFDPDRTGAMRAYLTDGSSLSAVTDPLDTDGGSLYMWPYMGNVLVVLVDVAGGSNDVVDAKFTLKVTLFPRYQGIGGSELGGA